MAVLPYQEILERIKNGSIKITPFDPANVDSCTIDLRLDGVFNVYEFDEVPIIDLKDKELAKTTKEVRRTEGQHFVLHSGEVVLGQTLEYVVIPNDLVAEAKGKSSLARAGVMVEMAPRIDPGFPGKITLELANHGKVPVLIYPGMKVCAVMFHELTKATDKPYKGKYAGITTPEPPKIGEEVSEMLRGMENRAISEPVAPRVIAEVATASIGQNGENGKKSRSF